MSNPGSASRHACCVCLLLLLFAGGCSSPKQVAPGPVRVGTITLAARSMPVERTLSGRTVAYEISEVRPQVGGVLRKRLFEEGQEVQQGQPLYEIDPAPYQAAYDTARGQLAQAEAAVISARPKAERYRTLVGQDAASKQDADDAESALKQAEAAVVAARAAVRSARINLDYTRIVAPIAGHIGTSAFTAGALVTAEQDAALTTIQRLDPIYLDVSQTSAQALALRKALASGRIKAVDGKAQLRVQLEDGTPYDHPGTLEFVGTSVDAGTGNLTLRAVIPNPEHLLMPGMYLRAVLPVAVDEAAILVPQQAVTRDSKGQPRVQVVGADDKVVERRIRTGDVVGHDWVVTAGLKPGERVVVLNGSGLEVGQKVQPYPVSEAQLATPALSSAADGDDAGDQAN
ncbi:efflux RND transporter periplasmic adaptor subunit [[Pseudomonas] boreopolis]|uniref:efflux RND transporter periplasmic adaptor subunit n=1 Tax=Xanthomonas boreopolis TaxID=86183 RepID=UPI003D9BB121